MKIQKKTKIVTIPSQEKKITVYRVLVSVEIIDYFSVLYKTRINKMVSEKKRNKELIVKEIFGRK